MSIEQAEALLRERPPLHRTRSGRPVIGGMNAAVGRHFIDQLGPLDEFTIAETGSGLSTLLFLALGAGEVISVSPAADLHERTIAEGRSRGLPVERLRMIDDRSESALPLLALVEGCKIDAAFIDGNHGWPAVFVDFCYLNRMLRRDGLLFVDDLQIYAVDQLVCLLRHHPPHFELVAITDKMATFRKTNSSPYLPDWSMQPFILANSATSKYGPIATSQIPPEPIDGW